MSQSGPPRNLLPRLTADAAGCWVWSGATTGKGYGAIWWTTARVELVHRVSFALFCHPIDPELTVDHLCLNKRCANPAHMEIVSRAENSRRKYARPDQSNDLRQPGGGSV